MTKKSTKTGSTIDLSAAFKLMKNVELAAGILSACKKDSDEYLKCLSDIYGAIVFLQQEITGLGTDVQKLYLKKMSPQADDLEAFIGSLSKVYPAPEGGQGGSDKN